MIAKGVMEEIVSSIYNETITPIRTMLRAVLGPQPEPQPVSVQNCL